jgi:hypothetical protein
VIFITSGKKKKNLVVCLAGARSVLQAEKKSFSRLSGKCAIDITTGKKKFKSSVWRVCDCYYERKKKILVVCLAGARSLLRPEKKSSSRLSGRCANYYKQKKKVLVICLAGARLLLRPGKKSSSRLSGGCAIVIMTGCKF